MTQIEIDQIMSIGKFMGFRNELYVYHLQRDPEPSFIYRTLNEDGDIDCDDEIDIYEPKCNWNQLMQVFEYIESKGYYAHIDPWSIIFIEYISGNELEIISYEFDCEISKIENYYYAITELIKKII